MDLHLNTNFSLLNDNPPVSSCDQHTNIANNDQNIIFQNSYIKLPHEQKNDNQVLEKNIGDSKAKKTRRRRSNNKPTLPKSTYYRPIRPNLPKPQQTSHISTNTAEAFPQIQQSLPMQINDSNGLTYIPYNMMGSQDSWCFQNQQMNNQPQLIYPVQMNNLNHRPMLPGNFNVPINTVNGVQYPNFHNQYNQQNVRPDGYNNMIITGNNFNQNPNIIVNGQNMMIQNPNGFVNVRPNQINVNVSNANAPSLNLVNLNSNDQVQLPSNPYNVIPMQQFNGSSQSQIVTIGNNVAKDVSIGQENGKRRRRVKSTNQSKLPRSRTKRNNDSAPNKKSRINNSSNVICNNNNLVFSNPNNFKNDANESIYDQDDLINNILNGKIHDFTDPKIAAMLNTDDVIRDMFGTMNETPNEIIEQNITDNTLISNECIIPIDVTQTIKNFEMPKNITIPDQTVATPNQQNVTLTKPETPKIEDCSKNEFNEQDGCELLMASLFTKEPEILEVSNIEIFNDTSFARDLIDFMSFEKPHIIKEKNMDDIMKQAENIAKRAHVIDFIKTETFDDEMTHHQILNLFVEKETMLFKEHKIDPFKYYNECKEAQLAKKANVQSEPTEKVPTIFVDINDENVVPAFPMSYFINKKVTFDEISIGNNTSKDKCQPPKPVQDITQKKPEIYKKLECIHSKKSNLKQKDYVSKIKISCKEKQDVSKPLISKRSPKKKSLVLENYQKNVEYGNISTNIDVPEKIISKINVSKLRLHKPKEPIKLNVNRVKGKMKFESQNNNVIIPVSLENSKPQLNHKPITLKLNLKNIKIKPHQPPKLSIKKIKILPPKLPLKLKIKLNVKKKDLPIHELSNIPVKYDGETESCSSNGSVFTLNVNNDNENGKDLAISNICSFFIADK